MPCEHGYRLTDGAVADWCPDCNRRDLIMSEHITAARKEFDGHDQNWKESQRKQEGLYAGLMASSAMCRAEELAEAVAALAKRVDALESRRNADVEALMQHINELYVRVQNLESRGADAEEPDVDDIRVVGVFQEPALDVALVIKAIRLYNRT